MSLSQRQKILKCLWSKISELQKCSHTEKSNYGLNLSIILMFLTIYGVGKSIGKGVFENSPRLGIDWYIIHNTLL